MNRNGGSPATGPSGPPPAWSGTQADRRGDTEKTGRRWDRFHLADLLFFMLILGIFWGATRDRCDVIADTSQFIAGEDDPIYYNENQGWLTDYGWPVKCIRVLEDGDETVTYFRWGYLALDLLVQLACVAAVLAAWRILATVVRKARNAPLAG